MIECGCCKKKFPKGCSGCETLVYNKINITVSGLPNPFFTGAVSFEQNLDILIWEDGRLYNPNKTYLLRKLSDYQLIPKNVDFPPCVYPSGATAPVTLKYLYGAELQLSFTYGSCLFGNDVFQGVSFRVFVGGSIVSSLSCAGDFAFRESKIAYNLSYITGSTNKNIIKAILGGYTGPIQQCPPGSYTTAWGSLLSSYRWDLPENNNNYDTAIFDMPKNANEFLTVTWSFS